MACYHSHQSFTKGYNAGGINSMVSEHVSTAEPFPSQRTPEANKLRPARENGLPKRTEVLPSCRKNDPHGIEEDRKQDPIPDDLPAARSKRCSPNDKSRLVIEPVKLRLEANVLYPTEPPWGSEGCVRKLRPLCGGGGKSKEVPQGAETLTLCNPDASGWASHLGVGGFGCDVERQCRA